MGAADRRRAVAHRGHHRDGYAMTARTPQSRRSERDVPDSAPELERRAYNLQQMIAVMQVEMIDCLVRAAFVRRERREHQDE